MPPPIRGTRRRRIPVPRLVQTCALVLRPSPPLFAYAMRLSAITTPQAVQCSTPRCAIDNRRRARPPRMHEFVIFTIDVPLDGADESRYRAHCSFVNGA